MRVLILGASGMLGSALVDVLSRVDEIHVVGTVRSIESLPRQYATRWRSHLVSEIDVLDRRAWGPLVLDVDVVINAVGVVKQSEKLTNRSETVALNALLPHELNEFCTLHGKRLIHISTDCVFSGRAGTYVEDDVPDPVDFYGRSKLLGEVGEPGLTLRTSIIGHEVTRHSSLIDWFLSQQAEAHGYDRAIYSGLTTFEFARLIRDTVLPASDLSGLYHVASNPISKYRLLKLVADVYGWSGKLKIDAEFAIDRSMDASKFERQTGYNPPSWADMVEDMYVNRPAWALWPRGGAS